MNEVLHGFDFPFVYLEDILISSSSEQEHATHLNMVLKRLSENGIRINVAKCVLGVQELSFLGHLVNEHVIRPLLMKVAPIVNYDRPKTVKDLSKYSASSPCTNTFN
ncbi:hypothetical protein AVEN_51300-1 [Araneus ventricosus]|uniref:Reverse transcriptase domain-containing protein n=1 Tax=Araneus ventricosus TaxID=182803 RepID=A0A4Y2SH20_ARAVE|nr:hypothetical protein AVEN_51300-1 [Araneus ventricosus]